MKERDVMRRLNHYAVRMYGRKPKQINLLFWRPDSSWYLYELGFDGDGEDVEFVVVEIHEGAVRLSAVVDDVWFRDNSNVLTNFPKPKAYGNSFEELVERAFYGFTVMILLLEEGEHEKECLLVARMGGPGGLLYASQYAWSQYSPGYAWAVKALVCDDGLWRFVVRGRHVVS